MPWFRDASYSPDWDFDPSVSEPTLGWDVLPPPDQLLEGRLRAVVHADDARWRAVSTRAQADARDRFGMSSVVGQYEALYERMRVG